MRRSYHFGACETEQIQVSFTKRNKIKQSLKDGKTVVGTMVVEMRTAEIARMLGASGFDFIFVDLEHSSYGLETFTDIVLAAKSVGLVCLARIGDPQYHLIARTLDAGAQGLMIPRVETEETVTNILKFAKYPPWGERGFGVRSIVSNYENMSVSDRMVEQNEDTMIILQIERKKAVEDIEKLVSVKGVDAAIIGPQDLSISLGHPGDHHHPKLMEAVKRVVDACEKCGVASGLHTANMEDLLFWARRGMRMLTFSSDSALLQSAASHAVGEIRTAIGSTTKQ
jgi:2-keto-3-deoxy-L-rhamnonate aldolase RhmA